MTYDRYAGVTPQPGRVRVRQYFPNFVTGFAPEVASIGSGAELVALPWIKRWFERAGGGTLRYESYCHDYPGVENSTLEYVIMWHHPTKASEYYVIAFADGPLPGEEVPT